MKTPTEIFREQSEGYSGGYFALTPPGSLIWAKGANRLYLEGELPEAVRDAIVTAVCNAEETEALMPVAQAMVDAGYMTARELRCNSSAQAMTDLMVCRIKKHQP